MLARISTLLWIAALVSASALLTATSATAAPTWEGGQVSCRSGEQVRLAISYRGILHIQWSEIGGAGRHSAGPYYSALYTTLTYDTGAPVVNWRAEAKTDNDNIPGDIDDAYAVCV
jgi:hypothetical protein